MPEPIALNASVPDLEQVNAEAIDAVCKELGLDADNPLSREIVAHEMIEYARFEHDPERVCEMIVKELKGSLMVV